VTLQKIRSVTEEIKNYVSIITDKSSFYLLVYHCVVRCNSTDVSKKYVASIVRVEALLATSFILFSCFAYFSTIKTEATYSSETSFDLQRTTRRYIPVDRILHNHRCENFKSYIITDSPITNIVIKWL
jgi:hypothetical protein